MNNTMAGSTLIVPTTAVQTAAAQTLAALQWFRYPFCAAAGVTYNFSLCTNGGTCSGDSFMELHNASCVQQTFNDDCVTAIPPNICSAIPNWTSSFTGTAFVVVRGFDQPGGNFGTNWGAVPSYTLAYWRN